ncbi:protein COBRA-like [Dioscorea cayenensis subsp. rotundata]|uniref:Protein COBRA-like n=1 Tax=Dioscorea cayennensis subsp. rotundata TaxID=55577 RepID=A0AB40B9D8_DIOCR|nr:protein COBRA-like [Dioscorea cayenensis subsp. rotundata]
MEKKMRKSQCVVSKSIAKNLLFLFVPLLCFSIVSSYDSLDPYGNITITWDIMSWTPDGYVAVVNISNEQQFRPVSEPGWKLGWTWERQEVIWIMVGAQSITQGDCSRFKGIIPHSCERSPTIVDLLPGTPYNDQISGCCRDGVLAPMGFGDPYLSTAGFQLTVGAAGNTNKTVRVPKNFTFGVEGGGYTCGPAKIMRPTRFFTPDGRRVTQALMTWKVVCTYSAFLVKKPVCCVSLSSADHRLSSSCKDCACGCRNASMACTGKGGAEKACAFAFSCEMHQPQLSS